MNISTTADSEGEYTQGQIDDQALQILFLKKFNRCPESYFINSILLIVYFIFANFMMLNLLIALFSSTYESVTEESEKIWKLNRFELVMEYWGKTPIVPPFVLAYNFFLLIKYFCFCRNPDVLKIVCWPRSPGDHAVHLRQFKTDDGDYNMDERIKEMLEFEKEKVQEYIEEGNEEEEDFARFEGGINELKKDVKDLQGNLQKLVSSTLGKESA